MKVTLFKMILFGIFGLAAVIGIFVFATHTGTNDPAADAIGPVVIWGTLPMTAMQNTLAEATKDDQRMKDVTYVQKSENSLPNELSSAIATGNAPDLVLASQEVLLSISKLIEPISAATIPASTFTSVFVGESSLLAVPTGDGHYGIPFLVDPLVLFYNRAILSSAGIAKPPETWEALTGLVPSVAIMTPTRQLTRELVALGTYDNVRNARAILSSLFLQTRVPMSSWRSDQLFANLTRSMAGETTSGRAVLNFYTQFADPSKVSYTWNSSLLNSQQMFLNGDLALYLGYVSEASFLKAANPNLDFAVAKLPQPATAKFKSAYGLLYSFMIPRGANNASGAYLAAALMSTSAMQTAAASLTGLAPAALDPLSNPPADPIAAIAYAEALYAAGWLSPAPAEIDAVFSSMITGVISGRLTPDTALTAGESALSALLQK